LPQLLSLALAAVSGMTEAPKPRSLITMEEGAMTVLLRDTSDGGDDFEGRYRPSIDSARDVVRTISDLIPRDTKVGKIKMVVNGGGAVFDLPMKVAKALLESGLDGFSIEEITSLPELEPETGFDRGGGGGRGGGGYRGGRGGGGGGYRGAWRISPRLLVTEPVSGRAAAMSINRCMTHRTHVRSICASCRTHP
jgi:hypothetical protein